MCNSVRSVVIGLSLLGAFAAGPARADAIDGSWCHGASSLTIDGPRITTPGGNQIAGAYSRHDFYYTIPAGEPGAGGEIRMVLLSEEQMRLQRPAPAAEPEMWIRCKPIS